MNLPHSYKVLPNPCLIVNKELVISLPIFLHMSYARPLTPLLPPQSAVCQGPLLWRVQAGTRIINECSAKEISTVFRTIVQSVFGVAGPSDPGMLGWGLQMFTKGQHPAEYHQLYNFLCSQGPLVSMALKHAHDPYMLFEFPISFLPVSLN